MAKSKELLRLFALFFKIGAFTFGSGMSVLAQLEREFITKRQRLTKAELLEITTVGKSLPGIMITNISMLMGIALSGLAGGFAAVLGLTLPAVITISAVTYFYDFFRDNLLFAAAMRGVSAAVVAIVLSSALSLGKEALKEKLAIIICAAAFLLGLFTRIPNALMIAAGAVMALIYLGAERVKR